MLNFEFASEKATEYLVFNITYFFKQYYFSLLF